MKKLALSIALASIIVAGCDPSDCCTPNVLSSEGVNALDFSRDGGTQLINLSSSIPWFLENPDQIPDWIQPAPLSGDSDTSVQVDVTPNPDLEPRCYTLVFVATNGDKLSVTVCQEGLGAYLIFLTDDTPRWEQGASVTRNDATTHTFITDGGAWLFGGDSKYKTGRITDVDGTQFEVIAFEGLPAVGVLIGAILYTPLGSSALYHCEILKISGTKLWMVFKETSVSAERRIVQ